MPSYEKWEQIAGYFDGDGTVAPSDSSNLPYKPGISLFFVDQSYDQIKNARDFLLKDGIRTSNVLEHSRQSAHLLAVSGCESVKKMLREMLLFLCEKEDEARATLDYLEDRITGNGYLLVFQEEVESSRRKRRPQKLGKDIPYVRPEGLEIVEARRKEYLRDPSGSSGPR